MVRPIIFTLVFLFFFCSRPVMNCSKKSCVFHPVEVVTTLQSLFLCILTFTVWAFPIFILLLDYVNYLRSSIVEIPDVWCWRGRYSFGCFFKSSLLCIRIILPCVLIFTKTENSENSHSLFQQDRCPNVALRYVLLESVRKLSLDSA
jgi:hypothetical protein